MRAQCPYCGEDKVNETTCLCREAKSFRTRMKLGPAIYPEKCLGLCPKCRMPLTSRDITNEPGLIVEYPKCQYREPYKSVKEWSKLMGETTDKSLEVILK